MQHNKYIHALVALLLFLLNLSAVSQSSDYVGSTQFFDLSGEWVNRGDSLNRRISRLEISSTIVHTYRIKPYFALGKKELAGVSTPIQISEKELCYTGLIADAKCFLVPMRIGNEEKIKMYSVIIDPTGHWTRIATDILERKYKRPVIPAPAISAGNDSTGAKTVVKAPEKDKYSIKDFLGFWTNEWEYDQVFPRLQFVEADGKMQVKIYKLIVDRVKLVGSYSLKQEDKSDNSQIIDWEEGEVKYILHLRPILLGGQLRGIDMLCEEHYIAGAPKSIYRQFFVRDQMGGQLAAAENLITELEGEWVNADAFAPTSRVVIQDGEIEIWGKCSATNGICSLGKKALSFTGDEMALLVGAKLPGAAFERKIEIDTDLDINTKKIAPTMVVFVMTSEIEDAEGTKAPETRTEVFRRRSITIPKNFLGINDNNNKKGGGNK